MEAHGYSPGPTQRPLLTGAASGVVGELAALPLLCRSGAWDALSRALNLSPTTMLAAHIFIMALAGLLYGRIFMRAANDCRGGWLFGISYGFLLWMLGPVAVIQWLKGGPVATGIPAMGAMGTQLLYGLVLGAAFPWVHRFFQPKLGTRLHEKKPKHLKMRREMLQTGAATIEKKPAT